MDKKIIFLELPVEMLEKIDQQNTMDTRSVFISELLEKQLHTQVSEIDISPEIQTSMQAEHPIKLTGEVSLLNSVGMPLGRFDINTVEGFENLAKKICEMSKDPVVRMRASQWR